MDIVLRKRIKNQTYCIAVSPNKTKIAAAGERTIRVYSYPGLKLIQKFKLTYTSSMTFLEDNTSIFVTNTTGGAFLWNGTTLEALGQWEVSIWEEKPVFSRGNGCVIAASRGGIYQYDIAQKITRNIFQSDRYMHVCRCENGEIKCVALKASDWDEADLFVLSLDGQIKHHAKTDVKIHDNPHRSMVWTDADTILFSSLFPQRNLMNNLFLVDIHGKLLRQAQASYWEDSGDFYEGHGLFVKICIPGCYTVCFYRADTLECLLKLERPLHAAYGITDAPACVWFAPDGHLLLGTWDSLCLFEVL